MSPTLPGISPRQPGVPPPKAGNIPAGWGYPKARLGRFPPAANNPEGAGEYSRRPGTFLWGPAGINHSGERSRPPAVMFQAGGEYPWVFGGHYRGMAALKPRCIQVPRNTSPVNYWEASPEKKSASVVASRGPCGPPRLSVALARRVDLKAALLAETRARGLPPLGA